MSTIFKPEEIFAEALAAPIGVGVRVSFESAKELNTFRLQLTNLRRRLSESLLKNYVAGGEMPLTGWEDVIIKKRGPRLLWVVVPTQATYGITGIEEDL